MKQENWIIKSPEGFLAKTRASSPLVAVCKILALRNHRYLDQKEQKSKAIQTDQNHVLVTETNRLYKVEPAG